MCVDVHECVRDVHGCVRDVHGVCMDVRRSLRRSAAAFSTWCASPFPGTRSMRCAYTHLPVALTLSLSPNSLSLIKKHTHVRSTAEAHTHVDRSTSTTRWLQPLSCTTTASCYPRCSFVLSGSCRPILLFVLLSLS